MVVVFNIMVTLLMRHIRIQEREVYIFRVMYMRVLGVVKRRGSYRCPDVRVMVMKTDSPSCVATRFGGFAGKYGITRILICYGSLIMGLRAGACKTCQNLLRALVRL